MAESGTASGAASALSMPEQVDIGNVAAVMASLAGQCQARRQGAGSCLVVDLAALKEFDSTVLSMLLEMRRQAGKPLQVLNPPPKLRSLAELYGVSELLLAPQPAA